MTSASDTKGMPAECGVGVGVGRSRQFRLGSESESEAESESITYDRFRFRLEFQSSQVLGLRDVRTADRIGREPRRLRSTPLDRGNMLSPVTC